MANYQPVPRLVTSASAISGTIIVKNLTTTSWGLFLLKGSALFSDTLLRSGAVGVWEDTATTSTRDPDRQTFTNAAGEYGITCKANVQILLKFYPS
ncbi:MAG: hypothetical protein ACERKZ_05385 [Lachnotalea sp.]